MDLAKTLIRSIARAFYDTKHVLVIDALMVHSALSKEDLASIFGMTSKELGNYCGPLRQDRMIAVHSRQEVREGQQRPTSKDYYYIDFHATIDAIKYRVYHLNTKVKEQYKPSEEKKEFFCPRCKAQYNQMEVLHMMSATGFDCPRCNASLEREELAEGASTGNEMQTKLASQMEKFLKDLQQIDAEDIPSNDFETAYSRTVPIARNDAINPARVTLPVELPRGPAATVKGMIQLAPAQLDVTVTSSSEKSAADRAAEATRKAAIAAQNALPEWHTKSTVTGESTVVVRKTSDLQTNGNVTVKEDEEDQKDGTKIDDELTAYYAQIAQEREDEAQADADSDEEEEDDFEDVGLGGSAVGTPSSSISAEPNGRPNGILKRKESESGSSAPVTNTPTPAASGTAADDEEGPVAKKVKFENGENGVEPATTAIKDEEGDVAEKDSDEDDEAEFEDAL